jgi:hypothetical protein
MNKSFEPVCNALLDDLKPGIEFRNWTILKNYIGDRMRVEDVNPSEIVVQAPKAKSALHVPRKEFEKIWEIWPEYKAERITRQEITDLTFYSKYIISILHWLEENRQ